MNPVPCHTISNPEAVPLYRRIWCRYYDRCLTIAAREGWQGFTCNECQAFVCLTVGEVISQGIKVQDVLRRLRA